MFARFSIPFAVVIMATPVLAQTPPGSPPAPVPVPAPSQAFPPGAEVLSVEGEPLGVLTEVEIRPGGERILHIRRSDGSMGSAPAVLASRGERAIVLEWTRAEFDATPAPTEVAASPRPPVL